MSDRREGFVAPRSPRGLAFPAVRAFGLDAVGAVRRAQRVAGVPVPRIGQQRALDDVAGIGGEGPGEQAVGQIRQVRLVGAAQAEAVPGAAVPVADKERAGSRAGRRGQGDRDRPLELQARGGEVPQRAGGKEAKGRGGGGGLDGGDVDSHHLVE